MKQAFRDLAGALRTIFGFGIMIALFAGGLTVVGYIVALCIGGATVNGAVEKSATTLYAYDKATQTIVTTVGDDQYRFGMEEGDSTLVLDTMTNDEKGVYAQLYTLDKENKPVALKGTPKEGESYLLGVAQKEKVYFVTGDMTELYPSLSEDASAAMDFKWSKKDDGFTLSHLVLDENGKPALDKNNNQQYKCVNMIYSGGKGEEIATFIANEITKPHITYLATVMVLLGLLVMYLSGEQALTVGKKEASKHEGEM